MVAAVTSSLLGAESTRGQELRWHCAAFLHTAKFSTSQQLAYQKESSVHLGASHGSTSASHCLLCHLRQNPVGLEQLLPSFAWLDMVDELTLGSV